MRIKSRAKWKATIRARVWRAETGKWEDLGVIAATRSTRVDKIKQLLLEVRKWLRF